MRNRVTWKKLLAVFLTVTMILSMSMTVFAAEAGVPAAGENAALAPTERENGSDAAEIPQDTAVEEDTQTEPQTTSDTQKTPEASAAPEVYTTPKTAAKPENQPEMSGKPEANAVPALLSSNIDVAENASTGTTYTSLQEAVSAAGTADHIRLLTDVTVDSPVVVSKGMTLDLNEKTLSGAEGKDWSSGIIRNESGGTLYMQTKGTLVLPSSSSTGSIVGICNQNAGSVIQVENLTILHNNEANHTESVTAIQNNGREIIVKNCDFQLHSSDSIFQCGSNDSIFTLYSGTYPKNPITSEQIKVGSGFIMVEENGKFIIKDDAAAKINRDGADFTYTTLKKAISGARSGETVILLKDIPESNTRYDIGKSITLDLNGHSVASTKEKTFFVNSYTSLITVTIKNGTVTNKSNEPDLGVAIFAQQQVNLTLENLTLLADPSDRQGFGLRVGNGENNLAPEVTVNGDATEINGTTAGITVIGSPGRQTARLTLNGGKVTGGSFGIAGNGANDNTDITINGGIITSQSDSGAAVYHPQDGNLTIKGGELAGAMGVQFMGKGKLSISGGSITGSSGPATPDFNSADGTINDGAALSVVSRGGGYGDAGSAEISITGGTFTSRNNIAIREYTAPDLATLIKSLEITQSGNSILQVTGGQGQAAVQLDSLSGDAAKVITAGTFSSDVSRYFDTVKYMQYPQDAAKEPGAVVPHAYPISYEYNGGTLEEGSSNPENYTFFDETFSLANPVRAGYTFEGWTGTGLTGTTKDVSIPKGSAGELSYEAVWSADDAFIRFETNGGSPVTDLAGKTGDPIGNRNMPSTTKEDYTFIGWHDKDGNAVEQLPERFPAETTVYTARWKALSGKNDPDVKVELPVITDDGKPSATVTDQKVIQAQKEYAKEIVTLLQNGNMPEGIPAEKAEQIKTLLENTAQEDKVTVVLSIQAEPVSDVSVAERNDILAAAAAGETPAVYLDLSVIMTVQVEKGDGTTQTVDKIPLSQVKEPILFEVHVDPALIRGKSVRIIHIHEGKTEFITPVSVDRENGIIRLYGSKFSTYALLTSDTVTVSFDSMGGSAVPAQTVPYHTVLTKPADPVRPGYTFNGWYTDKNYTAAYSFFEPAELPFTLYAKWTKDEQSGQNGQSGQSGQTLHPTTGPEIKTGTPASPGNGAVKTGDSSHPMRWAAALMAALLLMLAGISRKHTRFSK